jgi:SAM-dependent methyltransferase
VTRDVSLDESYDDYPRIEEAFQRRLDETLDPRGPDSLWDFFASLHPAPGQVVVDVGCGEGDDAIELARRFGVSVVAVDPVQRHVDVGRERAGAGGVAVTFATGVAERIPLDDEAADLLWCKEALMYTDLDAACAEFARVLRPRGRGLVYPVCTGPNMTDDEAREFWRSAVSARSVRPEDVAQAITATGLSLTGRIDLGGEWGEYAQERSGAAGRRLLHAARLLRAPDRYVEEFGETAYRIMLGDCLWHVYRMVGKLYGAVLLFERRPVTVS